MKLGVAFAWHVHPFEDLLDLVRSAERLGYAVAYVDGDATMLTARRNAEVLMDLRRLSLVYRQRAARLFHLDPWSGTGLEARDGTKLRGRFRAERSSRRLRDFEEQHAADVAALLARPAPTTEEQTP